MGSAAESGSSQEERTLSTSNAGTTVEMRISYSYWAPPSSCSRRGTQFVLQFSGSCLFQRRMQRRRPGLLSPVIVEVVASATRNVTTVAFWINRHAAPYHRSQTSTALERSAQGHSKVSLEKSPEVRIFKVASKMLQPCPTTSRAQRLFVLVHDDRKTLMLFSKEGVRRRM